MFCLVVNQHIIAEQLCSQCVSMQSSMTGSLLGSFVILHTFPFCHKSIDNGVTSLPIPPAILGSKTCEHFFYRLTNTIESPSQPKPLSRNAIGEVVLRQQGVQRCRCASVIFFNQQHKVKIIRKYSTGQLLHVMEDSKAQEVRQDADYNVCILMTDIKTFVNVDGKINIRMRERFSFYRVKQSLIKDDINKKKAMEGIIKKKRKKRNNKCSELLLSLFHLSTFFH